MLATKCVLRQTGKPDLRISTVSIRPPVGIDNTAESPPSWAFAPAARFRVRDRAGILGNRDRPCEHYPGGRTGLTPAGGWREKESAERIALKQLSTLFTWGAVGTLADGELLDRFVDGERGVREAAFAALVDRHGPMVLRVCQRVLHHAQDAEDAFQATFLVMARKAASIGKSESLASWLYGVAYRIALRARRDAGRRRMREVRPASSPPADPAETLGTPVAESVATQPEAEVPAVQ